MTTARSVSSVPPIAEPSVQPWRFNGPAAFPPRALMTIGLSYVSFLASLLFGYLASGRGAAAVAAILATLGALALLGACLALFGLSYAFRARSLTLLLLSAMALACNGVLLRHTVAFFLFGISGLPGRP